MNGHSDNIPNGDSKHRDDDDSKDVPPSKQPIEEQTSSKLSAKETAATSNGQHTKTDEERMRESIELMQRRRCAMH